MDTLKGKQIMVWTFMGNARMYEALRDYGDRISQIGLFSFKVRANGEIYESGVAISDMLTYINRWPHIKWLLTVANDGANSIFRALRDNTDGAQDRFLSEIVRIMEKYPWCDGIDIDLERGDGYSTHTESTAMFCNIALRSPLRSLPLRGNAAVAERKWASAHAARCGHRKPDAGCAARRRLRGALPHCGGDVLQNLPETCPASVGDDACIVPQTLPYRKPQAAGEIARPTLRPGPGGGR